ncbi:MAG: hypothetical protein IKI44_03300, partial [Bacteroidaceae bacterium]|nr:hypothetical protein [Bacteroidaceae bacterium]
MCGQEAGDVIAAVAEGHLCQVVRAEAEVFGLGGDTVCGQSAFVDADKREYVKYYEMLLPRMNPGGFILADNTLWYGRITEEAR